jgi:rubrerythrin
MMIFSGVDVLQYALAAEHMEIAFYNHINNYTAEDFAAAGFAPEIRERYLQIVENEKTHVDVLTSVITAAGVKPNPVCTYKLYISWFFLLLDALH